MPGDDYSQLGTKILGSPNSHDKTVVTQSEGLHNRPIHEFFENYLANFDRKGKQEILQTTKKQTVGVFIDKKSKKRFVAK